MPSGELSEEFGALTRRKGGTDSTRLNSQWFGRREEVPRKLSLPSATTNSLPAFGLIKIIVVD
jgi:hypothetical protein